MKEMRFTFQYRVSYNDTDQMKVAYYGQYLIWFERARTEFFRAHGFAYKDLEEKGYYLPVSQAYCDYKKSVFYDDLIDIVTKIEKLGPASITFSYEIYRDDVLLTTGYTKHPFMSKKTSKPVKILDELIERFYKD